MGGKSVTKVTGELRSLTGIKRLLRIVVQETTPGREIWRVWAHYFHCWVRSNSVMKAGSRNWFVCSELEPWRTLQLPEAAGANRGEFTQLLSLQPAILPPADPTGQIQHKAADKGVCRDGSPSAFRAEQKSEEWLWEQIATNNYHQPYLPVQET